MPRTALLSLLLPLLLLGCQSQQSTTSDSPPAPKEAEALIQQSVGPDQEAVALLALKYRLQPNLVEEVLKVYMSENDEAFRDTQWVIEQVFRTGKPQPAPKPREKSEVLDSVLRIAGTYHLEPALLAALLIDYKTICGKPR